MTDFAKTNYEDIEPMRADGPVDMRFSRSKLVNSTQIGVSRVRLEPNVSAPYGHHHDVQEEVYVVLSGSGQMKLDDEVIELEQWDVVHVMPHVTRAVHSGPDGLVMIAAGGQRPPEGDGHLVEDFWPA